ncbi:hypothetical protein LPJ75_001233, partial [Coemansia sp. RSA 2598]
GQNAVLYFEEHGVDVVYSATTRYHTPKEKEKSIRALRIFTKSLIPTAKAAVARHLANAGKGDMETQLGLPCPGDIGSDGCAARDRDIQAFLDFSRSDAGSNGLSSPITMPSTPMTGLFRLGGPPADMFSALTLPLSLAEKQLSDQQGRSLKEDPTQLVTPPDTEADDLDALGFGLGLEDMGFDRGCNLLRLEIHKAARSLPIEALEPLRAYLIAAAAKAIAEHQQQQNQQNQQLLRHTLPPPHGGNPYYRSMHHAAGMFTGFGIFSIGFVLVTSSTIFAGIRRATGLTFRRQLPWPPFNVRTSEKLLQWYDSRLEQINEKAEERIAHIISKYSGEIEDPNIRKVWERQIREDVMEKVERIRERRRCCADLVQQAKQKQANPYSQKSKRHHPLLAVYLFIGEKVFDKLLCWMRNNPHFCYENTESGGLMGAVSVEELLRDDGRGGSSHDGVDSIMTPSQQFFAQIHTHDIKESVSCPVESTAVNGSPIGTSIRDREAGRAAMSQRNAFYGHSSSRSPRPYIATAAPISASVMAQEATPEPSAPTLTESEYLRITSRQYAAADDDDYGMPGPSSFSASASTSRNPQHSQAVDPPPYTPIDGYTDICDERHGSYDSEEFENKTAIAQALN